MTRLPNARHEIFATGIAKGMVPELAYAAAGYKPQRQNAHRLKVKDDIRRRVAELQDAVAEADRPEIAEVIRELGRVALSNICDVVEWKGSQLRVIDSDKIEGAAASAIQEITKTRDGIRVKMHAKLPALIQLLDHLNAVEELRDQTSAAKPPATSEKVIDFKEALRHYSELSRGERSEP